MHPTMAGRRVVILGALWAILAPLGDVVADYEVIATIPVGSSPTGMTVDSNSRYAYISCSGESAVAVLDLATLTLVAKIGVGSGPATPLLSPDGATMLVPNLFSRSITVIDVATRTVRSTLQVGRYPSSMAFDASGSTAFAYLTVAGGDHELDIIDPTSASIVARIPLPPTAFLNDLWISPDGLSAYLADSGSGRLLVVDLIRRVVRNAVGVAARPLDVEPASDPNLLIVSCFGADSVSIVRRDTEQVRAQVPVGRRPFASSTHPVTGLNYVLCSGDQSVSVVDPLAASRLTSFAAPGLTGPSPRGCLAFDADGARLLVSGYQMSQVHAYGTDPVEPGGAYHALTQDITVASGPTQVYATSDALRVLVLCPSAGSVAVLEGITPLALIQQSADQIAAVLAAGGTPAPAEKNMRLALERLVGKSTESGAIAKLAAGDLSAALAAIQAAIQHLEKAQAAGVRTLDWQKSLADASARETRSFIDAVAAQVGVGNPFVDQAEIDYGTGLRDLAAGRYRTAVQDFKQAVDSVMLALP